VPNENPKLRRPKSLIDIILAI